jgi:hypothetical protein
MKSAACCFNAGNGKRTSFVYNGLLVVVTLSAGKSLQSGSFAGMLYKICDFFSVI